MVYKDIIDSWIFNILWNRNYIHSNFNTKIFKKQSYVMKIEET